jgi:hypothetical protein
MGGQGAAVMFAIRLLVGNFQKTAYQNSLLRLLYTREKSRRRRSVLADDAEEVQAEINNREPEVFNYYTYVSSQLISAFCCCLKQREWYKVRKQQASAHNEAFKRLSNEIDILNFIRTSRQLRLLTHTVLRTNQRQLVQYFKAYHIDYEKLTIP